MIIFTQIVLAAPVLSLAAWGLGRRMGLKEYPAAAIMAGWTAVLLVAAMMWLARLPAIYAAPVFVALVGVGIATAVAQIPRRELAWGALGGVMMGVLFALPFALQPRLLAYAHWGTDQWGYAGVSKWLMLHAVNELPVFEHKPGLAWVWTVLVTRDRPLTYALQAMLAASFGLEPSVAYYLLPAALQGSLFLVLSSSGALTGIANPAGRMGVAFSLAAQPSIWLHFQHQFFGGTLAALFLLILAAGLLEQHVLRRRDATVFACGAILAVLIGSLYTVNLSYAALGLVGLLWATAVLANGRVELATIRWRRGVGADRFTRAGARVLDRKRASLRAKLHSRCAGTARRTNRSPKSERSSAKPKSRRGISAQAISARSTFLRPTMRPAAA